MVFELINEPPGHNEPPDEQLFNEPPGGKCGVGLCDRDAVVELELQLQNIGGPRLVKFCGAHQMTIARQFMDRDDGGTVIKETCEIVYKGQRLRVEDGRLIREGPDG